MRRTFMLNLDDKHAAQLDELCRHFSLASDDTLRLAIRLTHARCKQKAGALVPEFKPRAAKLDDHNKDDFSPW
ncbi:hypothetical protein [Solirhodobacter olei]|uniref:hypothetical protein n=1 Tax=Solirhodobacter olei TaxID=2493082 RepID=UPI000FD9944E|nr:hypothetical protein [Solirhodobacter olei]